MASDNVKSDHDLKVVEGSSEKVPANSQEYLVELFNKYRQKKKSMTPTEKVILDMIFKEENASRQAYQEVQQARRVLESASANHAAALAKSQAHQDTLKALWDLEHKEEVKTELEVVKNANEDNEQIGEAKEVLPIDPMDTPEKAVLEAEDVKLEEALVEELKGRKMEKASALVQEKLKKRKLETYDPA